MKLQNTLQKFMFTDIQSMAFCWNQ